MSLQPHFILEEVTLNFYERQVIIDSIVDNPIFPNRF